MKILFISDEYTQDYMSDMLFHGLKSLEGIEVEELGAKWYMYDDIGEDKKKNLYGKGFTIFGRLRKSTQLISNAGLFSSIKKINRVCSKIISRLEEKNDILHSTIKKKIENKYYDLIIYGNVWRNTSYLDYVTSSYQKNKVIFIDGEDHYLIRLNLLDKGIYYKRELFIYDFEGYSKYVRPINFAIPKELIVDNVPQKEKEWATIIPGKLETYIYTQEKPYYGDYQASKFAITTKKYGWDCLRHYEILMNGAIPYFPNLEECPNNIMPLLPKSKLIAIRHDVDKGRISDDKYLDLCKELLEYTRKHLTTESLAKSLLNNV